MPTNRFIIIPDPVAQGIETVLDHVSHRVIGVANEYIKNKCDNHGNIQESNLTPEQQQGLKSLVKKVKDKEIIVQQTDKGGDLALYNLETYLAAMVTHTNPDPEISWDDHSKLESSLNASTIQTARILMVGAKWKHWSRVKSAVTSHDGPIPLLSGLPKTHKDLSHLPKEEQDRGPPVRPVCGASESNNGPLSDLLSQIIT